MLFSQIRQYVKGILANSFINKSTLDKLGENNNGLTFDGNNIESPQELTSQQMQDIKDAFSSMNKGTPLRMMHYSTEEQVVGTWIDEKKIYQKTVVLDNAITFYFNNTWQTICPAPSNNIDRIIMTNCTAIGDLEQYRSSISNPTNTCYDKTNQIIKGWAPNVGGYIGIKEITIQYTKTTD
jgi:hypothetical protein